MKILPLLALGGGIYLFTKSKKSSGKTESVVFKFGSKEIGYEVINCTKLTIYDKEKAFKYIFNLGAEQLPKFQQDPNYQVNSNMLMFGNCFQHNDSDTEEVKLKNQQKFFSEFKQLLNTKEKAEFIFTLAKYLFSGMVSVGIDQPEYFLARLSALRDAIVTVANYDITGLTINPSDVNLKV